MKTLRFLLIALLGWIFLLGCASPTKPLQISEPDTDDQTTGVCSVHGLKMRKHSVPVVYGLVKKDPGILEIQHREFPNALDDVGGGCVVGPETDLHASDRVFECPECRRKKTLWFKNNKDRDHITATPVPGRPGFVISPFTGKVVDVIGFTEGTLVKDPTTSRSDSKMKIFRVPAPSR